MLTKEYLTSRQTELKKAVEMSATHHNVLLGHLGEVEVMLSVLNSSETTSSTSTTESSTSTTSDSTTSSESTDSSSVAA